MASTRDISRCIRTSLGDVTLQIAHEVKLPGFAACDTHIHTFTNSHHGDSTIDERVLTLVGEGIELAIASDHNYYTDLSEEAARRMHVENRFTAAIGNEVTTKVGHFIAFPIATTTAPLPNSGLTDWPALISSVRAIPGTQIVVLNHPRDVHNDFIPFAPANFNSVSGDNLRGPEYTFDAVEVANSGTLQSDFMQSYRDWFALLNHGYHVTAVGSSDSHDVARFIVGQGRSYVVCDDNRDPAHVDIDTALPRIQGRACRGEPRPFRSDESRRPVLFLVTLRRDSGRKCESRLRSSVRDGRTLIAWSFMPTV